jgi:hypothetical protein
VRNSRARSGKEDKPNHYRGKRGPKSLYSIVFLLVSSGAMEMQSASEVKQLHFVTGILIVCIAGFLGGLVSGIGAIVESGRDEEGRYVGTKGIPIPFFLFGRCVVGIGGATAVLLASLSVNKFTGASDIDLLALSALCFVAGSIGYRLLPIVAAQLEKRLGEAEKRVEQAVKQGEKTRDSVGMTSAVITAMGLLDRKEHLTSVVDQTITSLEGWSKEFPKDRSVHIVLARLYRHKKDNLDKAISTLKRFIQKKGNAKDKDVADAYFNIACYLSVKAGHETSTETRSKLIESAFEPLKQSLKISPENKTDAESDDDLKELRTSPNFKNVLSSV